MNLHDEILALVRPHERGLTQLARKSGVLYQTLWRALHAECTFTLESASKLLSHFGRELRDATSEPRCEKCGCSLLETVRRQKKRKNGKPAAPFPNEVA